MLNDCQAAETYLKLDGVIHVEVQKLYPDAELPRFEAKELLMADSRCTTCPTVIWKTSLKASSPAASSTSTKKSRAADPRKRSSRRRHCKVQTDNVTFKE